MVWGWFGMVWDGFGWFGWFSIAFSTIWGASEGLLLRSQKKYQKPPQTIKKLIPKTQKPQHLFFCYPCTAGGEEIFIDYFASGTTSWEALVNWGFTTEKSLHHPNDMFCFLRLLGVVLGVSGSVWMDGHVF